jgi:hypothetical protein
MIEEATTTRLYLGPIDIIVTIDVPAVLSWFFISGSKFFHQVDGVPRFVPVRPSTTDMTLLS